MRKIFIAILAFYRRFISPLYANVCRYYPTCSSYALVLFRFDNIFLAFIKTALRILSCNPLFKGGFAMPYIYVRKENLSRYLADSKTTFHRKASKEIPIIIYLFVPERHSSLCTLSCLLKLQKFYIIPITSSQKATLSG